MAYVKVFRVTRGFQRVSDILQGSRTFLQSSFNFSSVVKDNIDEPFDTRMLQVLACPLSKKPLRYDEKNKELVCDELGVAYPIVGGIPNLNPQDGRMFKNKQDSSSQNSTNS